ncbi:MAG: hypothetical protein AAF236_04075 [Verrucomicrobiota bacterium]
MSHLPLDPDDPRLTAYALGEMPSAEVDEFAALLAESPAAQRELASLSEMADLLSTGLKLECENTPTTRRGLVLLDGPAAANVVSGNFRSTRRWAIGAMAAAFAAVLGVSALMINQNSGPAEFVYSASPISADMLAEAPTLVLTSGTGNAAPAIVLGDDLGSVSDLETILDGGAETGLVDASYIEAASASRFSNPQAQFVSYRPDSYLPPVGHVSEDRGRHLIEHRLAGSRLALNGQGVQLGSGGAVLVSGFVPMDGGVNGIGFETTGISGQSLPVALAETGDSVAADGQEILADMKAMQEELTRVIEVLGARGTDPEEQARLKRVLRETRRLTGEVQRKLSE